MEFNIKRVYTAVNADEVKVGSKVICAFTLKDLMTRVEEHHENITEIERILPSSQEHRFKVYPEDEFFYYPICYLVSEPEEKVLKWTDLKIGDVIRNKELPFIKHLITGIDEGAGQVFFCDRWTKSDELEEWEKV